MITIKAYSESFLVVGLVLTLAGMALQWNQSRHRMSLEERLKDGKVSGDQMRRRIIFYGRIAPVVTLLGSALLALFLFDLVG